MFNVYGTGFGNKNNANARVIDGNALAEKYIEMHANAEKERAERVTPVFLQSFDELEGEETLTANEGIAEDNFEALTADSFSDGADMTLNPDEVFAECEEMIKKANDQAEAVREAARTDAVAIRENAKAEGYEAGLNQAYDECNAAVEAAKAQMQQDIEQIQAQYANNLQQAEAVMIDIITSVYSKVFGQGLMEVKPILAYLINRTLLGLEGDDKVTVYVSSTDFASLEPIKDELFNQIALTTVPELKPRADFEQGQAKIETAFGILDCGIDTQLSELEKTLKLLSTEG